MVPMLVLRARARLVPLGDTPVAIGRLPECEVALDGTAVSRRHARILPTAEGPVLVDRSRFGTFVNGAQVVAPLLLAAGDVIVVGQHELLVQAAPPDFPAGRPPLPAWRRRFAGWRRRYGVAELFGAAALVLAGLAIHRATGSRVMAAYGATLADAVWFYGVLLLRARRQAAREARLGGFESRPLAELAHDLLLEFRTAEVVDALVLRPLCLAMGLWIVGGWPGLLLGKLVADLLFFGPVLALCHWRGAGAVSARPDPERERSTTSSGLPQIRD